jgi:hypothetical protein
MFTRSLLNLLIIFMLLLTACVDIPDPKIELLAASLRDLRVEFASDPQMLARIDAITALLEKGVKAGFDDPTNAALVKAADELSTIQLEISKDGLNPEVSQRLDVFLEKMDRMLTIHVDEPTRALWSQTLEKLEEQPDLWREAVSLLIPQLEQSSMSIERELGTQLKDVISKADESATHLILKMGIDGKCNVDFFASRTNDSIQTFIGKNLHAVLEKVWTTGERPDLVPIPGVCHVVKTRIDLISNGTTFVLADPIIWFSGWNFHQENLPNKIKLFSADGRVFPLPDIKPLQLTAYEFQVNLQGLDLGQAGQRSYLEFEWPNLEGVKTALPIVFPLDPPPTPSPTSTMTSLPQPIVTFLKDKTPIYYYPCTWCWNFAYRNAGDQLRVISLVVPDGIFYKVDVNGTVGYVYRDDVQLNIPSEALPTEPVPTPTFAPPPSPTCRFDATPKEINPGESAVLVWDVENAAKVELSFNGKIKKVAEHKRREVSPSQTTTYMLIVTDKNSQPVKCSPDNSITIIVDQGTPTPTLPPPPTSAPPPYPSDLVWIVKFPDLGRDVDRDTGISADQWDCGIAGFNSDIAKIDYEGVKSSVLDLFAYHHGGTNTWWIRADFATAPYLGPDKENWDITLICLNRSYPDLILGWGYNFNPGEYRVDTGISVQDYACGMFGFYIRNSDIEEHDAGDIVSAYLFDEGGTYHAYLNFRTHRQEPERALSVLCIKKLHPDQLILDHYPSIGDNPNWSTQYSYDPYVCVPAGYAILGGDIDETDANVIMHLNTYRGNDNNWWIRGDFHSHHTAENWSVDLLCLSRSMVVGEP